MMTDDEARTLLDVYAPVRHAVAWTEHIVCVAHDPGEVSGWQLMMDAPNPRSPVEVVELLRDTLEELVREDGGTPKFSMALAEMDRPEFVRYVAGKMGCM